MYTGVLTYTKMMSRIQPSGCHMTRNESWDWEIWWHLRLLHMWDPHILYPMLILYFLVLVFQPLRRETNHWWRPLWSLTAGHWAGGPHCGCLSHPCCIQDDGCMSTLFYRLHSKTWAGVHPWIKATTKSEEMWSRDFRRCWLHNVLIMLNDQMSFCCDVVVTKSPESPYL